MEYAVPSWTQIESLVLTRTALSGTIPDFVNNGSLRHLTTFIADYTMLSGSLPESLSFASNLQTLSIGGLESLWSGCVQDPTDFCIVSRQNRNQFYMYSHNIFPLSFFLPKYFACFLRQNHINGIFVTEWHEVHQWNVTSFLGIDMESSKGDKYMGDSIIEWNATFRMGCNDAIGQFPNCGKQSIWIHSFRVWSSDQPSKSCTVQFKIEWYNATGNM